MPEAEVCGGGRGGKLVLIRESARGCGDPVRKAERLSETERFCRFEKCASAGFQSERDKPGVAGKLKGVEKIKLAVSGTEVAAEQLTMDIHCSETGIFPLQTGFMSERFHCCGGGHDLEGRADTVG